MRKVLLLAAFGALALIAIVATIGYFDVGFRDLTAENHVRYFAILAATAVSGFFAWREFKPRHASKVKPVAAPPKISDGPITPAQLRQIIDAARIENDAILMTMFRPNYQDAVERIATKFSEACRHFQNAPINDALLRFHVELIAANFDDPLEGARAFADLGELAIGLENVVAMSAFEVASAQGLSEFWIEDGLFRARGFARQADAVAAREAARALTVIVNHAVILTMDHVIERLRNGDLDSALASAQSSANTLEEDDALVSPALSETFGEMANLLQFLVRRARNNGRPDDEVAPAFFRQISAWLTKKYQEPDWVKSLPKA